MNYLTAITPKADQAQADLDCIDAAREAVKEACQRIMKIRHQNMCRESFDALMDAEKMLEDAFEDAVGSTVFELMDKKRECAQ